MPQFEVSPKVKINYDIFPHSAPQTTFFVHGNLASNRWWMPTVEELRKKYPNASGSVICAEFRGCGGSSTPEKESDVTMDNFANDFISLIRSLKLEKVNLVGHSTGGLIIAMMLAKAPELFNKAFMLDPVGAVGVKFDSSMIQAFEAMKIDKNLTAAVIGSTIHNNNPDAAFFKDIIVEDAFKSVKQVGHLVLKALDGLDVREQLKSSNHQVMVMHGEHDQLLPKADSEKLAKIFNNGRFEVLRGCGHCGNYENPKLFVDAMAKFLYS